MSAVLCNFGLHIPYRRIGYTTFECWRCPEQWVGPIYLGEGHWEQGAVVRLLEKRIIGSVIIYGWRRY